MSNVLLFIEHAHGSMRKSAQSLLRFAQEVTQKSGGKIYAVMVGHGLEAAAKEARQLGITTLYTVDAPALAQPLADTYATAVCAAQKACDASLVAAASSSTAKDFLPRVAVRLGAGMASDVLSVVAADTFVRPMWAGNVLATVQLCTPTKVCTVRPTDFAAAPLGQNSCATEALAYVPSPGATKVEFVALKEVKSERPDVTTAERIVSCGRGIKSAEGFKLIEQLADTLHAGVGASRAVCDAGWVANDLQIGQTGKIVAPNLYVAVGISGAIQHLAGMKGSKTIVAINKDPEAPIFAVADYGLVADLFVAVPELDKALKA